MYYLAKRIIEKIAIKEIRYKLNKYGHLGKDSYVGAPDFIGSNKAPCFSKIYIGDRVLLRSGFKIIMRDDTDDGRFVMKSNSQAAQNLTVITNNHPVRQDIRSLKTDTFESRKKDMDSDVIIEEDVWIGSDVTILPGVVVGRGAVVGACSLVRRNVPPYAVVLGNPARIVSFVLNPDEIEEHEKALYPPQNRLERTALDKAYNKYFQNRIDKISEFLH